MVSEGSPRTKIFIEYGRKKQDRQAVNLSSWQEKGCGEEDGRKPYLLNLSPRKQTDSAMKVGKQQHGRMTKPDKNGHAAWLWKKLHGGSFLDRMCTLYLIKGIIIPPTSLAWLQVMRCPVRWSLGQGISRPNWTNSLGNSMLRCGLSIKSECHIFS